MAEPRQVWQADRQVYWRDTAWLMVLAMLAATGVLWALGNPDYWVGAIAGFLAIALRNGYLASEELGHRWELVGDALTGPGGRRIALCDIDKVRRLGSTVQIVTRAGNKHLIKYLADPLAVQTRIAREAGVGQ